MSFLRKLLGDPNARIIKKLWRYVEEVNTCEERMSSLTDNHFPELTVRFKERLAAGETLEDILPEAFALVREAARRTLGMRPFDVQVLGGVVLHQGRIAEMKTGEGKTLVATMPAYLNALSGKGVHIVTVNDYLARRDREWMGPVYEMLGLELGVIVHGLDARQRRAAYHADITYGTNNEFGFDYLRDNMVLHREHLAQRPLHYAIVDEVDSILIDEARTPLIISGAVEKPAAWYERFDRIIPRLQRGVHYEVDEKAHTVDPTEEGFALAEKLLNVSDLSDDLDLHNYFRQAIKAHALMKRDRDYVVRDGEVVIVDEFTGRLMFGRRYSDGLHQAIEAKEKVKVARESRTLASITFQNYFRMYEKLSGMTGTASTEEDEFRKIYGMDVVIIPTNEPMIRQDFPDAVYRSERGKFNAVVEEIAARHETGQPILVGTISIEKSEELGSILARRGIRHHVLNAKHHEKEAEIVAQAGQLGAVTIATNMAGRGTDIVLGGNQERKIELVRLDGELTEADKEKRIAAIREAWHEQHAAVVARGGLHIVGTERHESRRIDNQLRGRSGRQGDPGSSRFFVSLEDDLMRLFGSDNARALMERLGMEEDVPVEHPLISKAIENAQKKVEGRNFEIRKHILEYDDVLNMQREVIYRQRRQVLEGETLRPTILEMIADVVEEALGLYLDPKIEEDDWDLTGLRNQLQRIFLPADALPETELRELEREEIREKVLEMAHMVYGRRETELGAEILGELERVVLLRTVDEKWMNHIDEMHELRQGVGLRGYGQQDPLVEYRRESYEMFQDMIHSLKQDVVRLLFHLQVGEAPERKQAAVPLQALKPQDSGALGEARQQGASKRPKGTPVTVNKIGRNEPCPCGSGRKYKKCCGRDN